MCLKSHNYFDMPRTLNDIVEEACGDSFKSNPQGAVILGWIKTISPRIVAAVLAEVVPEEFPMGTLEFKTDIKRKNGEEIILHEDDEFGYRICLEKMLRRIEALGIDLNTPEAAGDVK